MIQTFVQSKGVEYVRIDGSTLPQDRLKSVNRFRSQREVIYCSCLVAWISYQEIQNSRWLLPFHDSSTLHKGLKLYHCHNLRVHHATNNGLQVKVAIVGLQAGGVGLDFSAAQSVVFVELPKSASEMLQVRYFSLETLAWNLFHWPVWNIYGLTGPFLTNVTHYVLHWRCILSNWIGFNYWNCEIGQSLSLLLESSLQFNKIYLA